MKENSSGKFSAAVNCPIRQVLDRFGDKWSILVVELLSGKGRLRFSEIGQHIGDISQKMLTVTLRSLESDGLISREIFPEIPPRVEYELTALGKSLVPHIESLTGWGVEHLDAILQNRKAYELRQKKTTY
ncbi:transcriptional regulator [Chitinophaga oryziterrae]|uniref:Transcriptional regulator n=1 Tax=Chitinophaga oryziterrae TaxID=1031224 RepID=A0A6N8JAM6_9BACT|nr:helix-turn-helix domain-containing protein [Chitinophaga oryziterrae]MVT42297.1 transcriptional regulator [Chitinophaga oryziterrae]